MEPTKEVYEYGEDILADFDSVYAYPNTMIVIVSKDHGRASSLVLTGCNNYWGDQRWSHEYSHNCIKTQKSGQVMFTRDNTYRNEHLDAGEYEMRILYYTDPFMSTTDDIADVVSATFTVNPKHVSSKSPSSKSPSITASADDD